MRFEDTMVLLLKKNKPLQHDVSAKPNSNGVLVPLIHEQLKQKQT